MPIPMTAPMTAPEVLDREFLGIRAKLLEVAASLDRIGRAEGSVDDDPRLAQLRAALQLLVDASADRAEQFQMLFSLPYDENWQDQ